MDFLEVHIHTFCIRENYAMVFNCTGTDTTQI